MSATETTAQNARDEEARALLGVIVETVVTVDTLYRAWHHGTSRPPGYRADGPSLYCPACGWDCGEGGSDCPVHAAGLAHAAEGMMDLLDSLRAAVGDDQLVFRGISKR
jgi:hypothetical protein